MNCKVLIVTALLACMISPAYSAAASKARVVEAEGKAEISAGRTPDEARGLALDRARRTALEEVVGVDVRGSTVIYNADLINDMVMTGTRGIIVGQEILFNECISKDRKLICTVRIKAEVKELDRSANPPFSIKAKVQRPGRKSRKDVVIFQEGDEVQVSVKLDKEGYLTIFSVDQFGKVYPLFPNKFLNESFIEAGTEFVFPSDDLRARGLKLRVQTLEGQKKSNESLVIIATKRKVALLEDSSAEPVLTELMAELANLDHDTWAQVTKGYIIMK